MLPDTLFWWILGGAAALSFWWVKGVFGANIETDMFVGVVQKLVREKNLVRAIKLCNAAGDAPVAKATMQALIASVSREEDEKRPVGYRGSRPVPMDAVRARIRARYDEGFNSTVAPVHNSFYAALPAPFVFVAIAGISFFQPEKSWPVIGAAGTGLLVWLYFAWTYGKILSSRNAAFESLWPSFEAVYHDRNAIDLNAKPIPPPPPEAPQQPPALEVKNQSITFEILEPGKPLRSMTLDQPIIKIGKMATSHVQLTADGVARMHAVIEISEGKATIIDLGAEKQTKVNLENVNKRELVNGDVIGIGDAELVVRVGSPPDRQT